MAQLIKTTSTPLGYTIATMQAAVTSLISSMVTGQPVNAVNVASLNSSIYDLWRNHTHTAVDTLGQDIFGNLTVYGVGGTTLTRTTTATSPTYGAVTTPTGIAADQQISAADINVLIGMVNSMRSHAHTIFDGQGVTGPAANLVSQTLLVEDYVPVTLTLTFNNNGILSYNAGNLPAMWINMAPVDAPTAASYDVRVIQVSGSAVGGTLNTWLNLATNQSFSLPSGAIDVPETATITVEIRESVSLVVVATCTFILQATYLTFPFMACFPAGSKVLMANGTWKNIETVEVGDHVMGLGKPEPIVTLHRPLLGPRRLFTFQDNSLIWSEDHALWTRTSDSSEWWWTLNPYAWRKAIEHGITGGLRDSSSIRTGDQVAEWAHINGWKANTIVEHPRLDPNVRLYLPQTASSPIIVNGYLVDASKEYATFDYADLNWDEVRQTLPVVQSL